MKGLYKKIGATIVGALAAVNVMALDELNVAYFEEWPMPFEYAKQIGAYDEALGMTVNWKAFGTGTAMSAAMASGDIDISVSQGVPPFIVERSILIPKIFENFLMLYSSPSIQNPLDLLQLE